jgi:hypothetical protein
MQFVFFDAVCSYWLKGSQAHMQRDLSGVNAALLEARQYFGGEMETGGWSRHGTALLRVYGLVALAVVTFAIRGGIDAGNVGWEGNVSNLLDSGEKICDRPETDAAFAERTAGHHFCLQFVIFSEEKLLSYSDLAARTDQALPVIWILGELPSQQDFDTAMEKIPGCGIMWTDRMGLKP